MTTHPGALLTCIRVILASTDGTGATLCQYYSGAVPREGEFIHFAKMVPARTWDAGRCCVQSRSCCSSPASER